MKKRILISILVIAVCFVLIGCGKENNENISDPNNTTNNVENNSNNENTNTSTNDNIHLYSDNTKYVFEFENVTYVFYYSGDEITAYHTYIDYEDAATAQYAYQFLKKEDLEEVDKYYVSGKYLVFEYNKSQYEDMKVSDLKTVYSYMTEVTK